MSKQTIKPVALIANVAGIALTATLAATPAQADTNPFAMSALTSGYMVADARGTEGQCGANKGVSEAECGANKAANEAARKAGEGECGANKKPAEGECGANKAQRTSTAKPIQEAKCGEAKCGSNN